MAKNNFKAKEAVNDANYAQGIGSAGASFADQGATSAGQGFSNLQDTFGAQKNFASMLADAAAGKGGPTMADQQIKDATARNNANAAGFAAGAKGLNPALAARQALMAQAGNSQQAAGQAAQTRVQEQLAARSQLGGALAGQAGTAGAQTSGGIGAFGTGAGAANQSNANLINSRNSANDINEKVAQSNAGAINGMIGGVLNAAGGAFGLAEGGVVPGEPEGTQNSETEIALAHGGMVHESGVGGSLPRMPAGPHRSFAAQVAHHLSREYFAEGGMAEHESYKFEPMNLRDVKKPKQAPQHMQEGLDLSPTRGTTAAEHEGQDSEGKEKHLRLADGGEVPEGEESSMERQLRERDAARERHKEKDTQTAMGDLERQSQANAEASGGVKPEKKAYGGYASGRPDESEEDYNPADDEPESDDAPDTDAGIDPEEAKEKGIPQYAEGGDVSDESAGLDMRPMDQHTNAAIADTQRHPSALQRIGAGLSAFGSSMGGGPPVYRLPAGASTGKNMGAPQAIPMGKLKRIPTGGEGSALPAPESRPPLPTDIPVREPGGMLAMDVGGPVPGKAQVDGNSLKNDVVDAKLSPGEIVLPRTISHDPEKAKKFVQHLMNHGGSGHQALKAIKGKR